MRWLEWTLRDPRGMVGGVETHLLSMVACLERRGVEVSYSSDPSVLFEGADEHGPFDVIRTHGAALPPRHLFKVQKTSAVRVHTLHGSSLGMMGGLGEWHRFTHLKAFYREYSGMVRSDLLAAIHPDHSLLGLSGVLGVRSLVIWNGWDPTGESSASVDPVWGGRWAFVGRLWDRMKGADRVMGLLESCPDLQLLVIPGDGLPDHPRILKTGRLGPAQVRKAMAISKGLLLPSRYEGLPLVMLEALGEGVPVVSTKVGGIGYVEKLGVRGWWELKNPDCAEEFAKVICAAEADLGQAQRALRAEHNQKRLWTWESCTQRLIEAINPILLKKAGKQIQISAKP